MTQARQSSGFVSSAMRLLFWVLVGTATAVVFGVVFAAVMQLVAFGGVLYLFLALGAVAGAIAGPVFGAAYWIWIGRRQWSSRVRAALGAGVLGGLIFAIVGAGYCAWEAAERSRQPTKRPLPARGGGPVVEAREGAPYSGGVIVATPEGGRVIEQRENASAFGRQATLMLTTIGVTATGGFLYGALFGAVFHVRGTNQFDGLS